MRKGVVLLLFLMGTIPLFSNDINIVEDFFSQIKNLEYEKASKNTKLLERGDIYELLNGLSQMLITNNSIEIKNLSPSVEKDDFLLSIYYLVKGYSQTLNKNPENLAAFKSFQKSLDIATKISNDFLAKAGLIAQLDLFKKEIFIGSKQYRYYLKRFKDLKSDPIDEVLDIFYTIIFFSKGDGNLTIDALYKTSFYKLDSILPNLQTEHKLFPQYYYEKAIFGKIDGNYEQSIEYFKKAIHATGGIRQFVRFNCVTNWQIADTYLSYKKPLFALRYLEKSEDCAVSLKDNFYDVRLCSEIQSELKNYDYAYSSLKKSVDIEYNLGYKNNTLESAILAEQSNVDLLEFDNVKLDNKRKQNQNWLIAAGIVFILGLGVAILLQKNTSKKHKLAEQEALLEQQKIETLLKEQELTSIDAMIEGQEKERTKVANELHDDLGSLMATVKLHFDNVKMDQNDPALMNAQRLLDEAYQKIRGMAHSKNSGVMANQGLLPAVRKMAKTISETNALKINVEDFGLGERMENSLELTIFRIIQELTANIIKHSGATKANIQFTQHEDKLNIIVEDNGKGFDMTAVKRTQNGMGLGTIEKRIEHLEGAFTVDSVRGKGASILIDIPI